MFNWLSQVASVTLFNLRTIPERLGSALTTALGVAGVVIVFVGVLSIAEGFRKAMTTSGSDDIVIVMRAGSDTEMSSGLTRDNFHTIEDAPGLARTKDGPEAAAELLLVINVPKRSTGTDANVPFRGVGPESFTVRGNIKIVQGRQFQPGRNEIIVGAGAAREFAGLDVGKTVRLSQSDWTVVGIFTADGGVAESEVWADAEVVQPAYHRGDNFQSVYGKLASPASYQQFADALAKDPQLNAMVKRQKDYYADQSTIVTTFIRDIGIFVASMMGLGALFGALNTMYSAVAARTREIATLRALGFGSAPIILSVLVESLVLALIGGALGSAAAYFIFNGFTATTMNWQTFSQVAFAFSVTPAILTQAMLLTAIIGLFGGLFPAIRASRLPIAAALRET